MRLNPGHYVPRDPYHAGLVILRVNALLPWRLYQNGRDMGDFRTLREAKNIGNWLL